MTTVFTAERQAEIRKNPKIRQNCALTEENRPARLSEIVFFMKGFYIKMKQVETWERPKTSRVYLHPHGSERLVMAQPDMKIVDLDLCYNEKHYDLPGFGAHLLVGEDPCDFDTELTRWKRPEGGLPIYTLYSPDPESGCETTMTVFSDTERIPASYCEVKIKNPHNEITRATLGILPRFATADHYLTGLHDTGYEPYNCNARQWYLCRKNPFSPTSEDPLTARAEDGYGEIRILSSDPCGSIRWISREEQKNRMKAHDYYRYDCVLQPGESATVRFVLRKDSTAGCRSYDDALKETVRFWSEIQKKVKILPDNPGKNTEDMFRQSITVMLQMLQRYKNPIDNDLIFARQGDVGRFLWVWEAVHFLTLLDRVGLSSYVTDAYRTFFRLWQKESGKEKGKLDNPYVPWDNTTGACLAGLSYHLTVQNDPALFAEFHDRMTLAADYIQYRRSLAGENEYQGLFPAGQGSDWGEIGQHWTFTDAVNAYGLGIMAKCYENFGATDAASIRAVYTDYHKTLKDILNRLAAEHHGEHAYILPHILGISFEESYNHCFYTAGAPYLLLLDIMEPDSEIFEQMENFYREIGFLDDEHGLAGRMTNDACGADGLYGHVYYTGVAEPCWIHAWTKRGETEKAEKYANGILRYNVTPEYMVCERYASVDPWFTPWQPNASGAGRLDHFLLNYYGEKPAKTEG